MPGRGEISLFRNNGGLPGIQLDVQTVEAEILTTPFLQALTINQFNGPEFDEWGNVVAYSVLKRHPGDTFIFSATMEHETLASSYVARIYHVEHPGQHRHESQLRQRHHELTSLALDKTLGERSRGCKTHRPLIAISFL